MGFLSQLVSLGFGHFSDTPLFIDEFENINADLKGDILPQNNFIHKAFIELGSNCNLNCGFCEENETLFRKTGCKKWSKYNNVITTDRWEDILRQLSYLKCKSLSFIGGNPLLQFESLINIINTSKNYGFTNYTIFTNGTLLSDSILEQLNDKNVTLNIQILSFNPNNISLLGLNDSIVKEIHENLMKLKDKNINVIAQILINKYNENEIESIINQLSTLYNIKNIKLDYIYNVPENTYYSTKYISDMYKKQFGKVTIDKFNYLQNWNSCLKGQIVIRQDGEVLPCPMIRKSIGNIFDAKLCDLLKRDEYIEYTKITRKYISSCKECSYKYNCVDCRAIEMSATNNLYGLHFCDLKENYE